MLVAETVTAQTSPAASTSTPLPVTSRRGQRERAPSVKLKDYVTYDIQVLHTHHAPTSFLSQSSSTASGTTPYPLSEFISDSNFSPGQQVFLAAITAEVEPKHFAEAVLEDVWNDSMFEEVDALEEQHTWDIVTLPPGKVVIPSEWVYRIKYNADGTIKRHKSRLVVNGSKQVEGEDY